MRMTVIVGASSDVHWDHRWTPDLVVCADGGLNSALALGLKPNVVIGDNDSGGIADVLLPVEKNMTDMEACLDYVLSRQPDEIALLGATGGRIDHFMGNLGLLERAKGCAFLLDASHEIRLLTGSLTVPPPHLYRYFSVVPLDETVTGVDITGAKYPLTDATLHRDATLGISNEPLPGETFTVYVKSGKALLILSEKIK